MSISKLTPILPGTTSKDALLSLMKNIADFCSICAGRGMRRGKVECVTKNMQKQYQTKKRKQSAVSQGNWAYGRPRRRSIDIFEFSGACGAFAKFWKPSPKCQMEHNFRSCTLLPPHFVVKLDVKTVLSEILSQTKLSGSWGRISPKSFW